VDDINLLDDELVNILLNVIADGSVTIEREGLSVRYPCKPLLLASYNPAEGELREHLLDRIAMSVPADVLMSVKERVDVVINVEGFQDKSLSLDNALQEEDDIHQAIAAARILLPKIEMSHEQLLYICQEATRADCKGQRAEIFAAQIAKTSAALGGRMKVNAGDLQRGVLLAIVPRSKVPMTRTDDADSELQPQAATLPLPPPPDMIPSSDTEEKEDEEEQEEEDESQEEETPEENDSNKESEEEPDSNEESEEELAVPEEFMFGVDAASIDPRLLRFDNWTRKGKGGKRSRIFNLLRGRFVKAVFPKGEWKRGKIAIGGTLRAAAPFQKIRRAHAKDDKLVYIRDSDFRIKRMARKAGSLVIFVVDSSGSMALNRMGAAKGAAMSLLQEAYKSRDKICLISFHDERAEILVPPTKSSALTKRRLEGMPCGGGSPLAHGLVTAIRTGLNAIKVKKDVGRVVVVLLTDGRANVPLCVSEGEAFDASIMDRASTDDKPTRGFLKDEVLAVAKRLGSLKDFNLLCIDTEDRYVGTGFAKELSRVAQGNYHHMSTSNDREVTAIAKQGLEHARQAMAS
jgi:magnesium chelatase subunit D